jgi:hypothetical protein
MMDDKLARIGPLFITTPPPTTNFQISRVVLPQHKTRGVPSEKMG